MTRLGARRTLTADDVTDALIRDGDRLALLIDGASTHDAGDAGLLITGVPVPTLNGVLTLRTSARAADVAHLLDIVEKTGLQHALSIRPGCSNELVELAVARGLVEDEPIPLMAMERDLEGLRRAAEHPRLVVRELKPEEAHIHAAVAAPSFAAPAEVFDKLVPPSALRLPGFRAYAGSVDGEPVTTAVGSTLGDFVGIFDVATPEVHRGHGYGAAITARAALDGFDAGASFAYLQSSAMGYKIYERLGFRTLETWSVWVSAPSHS
jgi:hypothetical protein